MQFADKIRMMNDDSRKCIYVKKEHILEVVHYWGSKELKKVIAKRKTQVKEHTRINAQMEGNKVCR